MPDTLSSGQWPESTCWDPHEFPSYSLESSERVIVGFTIRLFISSFDSPGVDDERWLTSLVLRLCHTIARPEPAIHHLSNEPILLPRLTLIRPVRGSGEAGISGVPLVGSIGWGFVCGDLASGWSGLEGRLYCLSVRAQY